MSALIQFLESRQWKDEELVHVFFEQFGVKVHGQDNLYQFKYDDRTAKLHLDVTRECRGAIVSFKAGKWEYLARPFDKFFNLNEGSCPLFSKKDLRDFGKNLTLIEKTDGSLLILWWNPVVKKWAISTSGAIKTQKPLKKRGAQSTETFEDLFYRVSKLSEADLTQLDKAHTYLFELCSAENPVITQYAQEKVYLLGIRANASGAYLSFDSTMALFLTGFDGIHLPEVIKVEDLGLTLKDELVLFVEQQSRESKYGKWPEGFVLYVDQAPIAKLKNRTYLQCFYTLGGDKVLAKKGIMEAVISGSIDDIYGHLDEELQAYADELKHRVAEQMRETYAFMERVGGNSELNPRAFAFAVKTDVLPQFQSFFFKNRQALLNGTLDGRQAFEDWLHVNLEKIQL